MFVRVLLLFFTLGLSYAGTYNLTVLPLESGSVEFSWISSRNGVNLYYILCSPEVYSEDYQTELTYFTSSTSAILSGFQEGKGYVCTLTTVGEGGTKIEESIQIKSLGGLTITFVGNTPSVDGSSIAVKFSISGSVSAITCCLLPKPQSGNNCVKCTDGEASFSDVSPGNYRLRIFAKNSNYDKLVVIRVISVPDTSYGCAVNLINDAVTVSDGGATIQFAGVGDVTEFACFLDGEVLNDECLSPMVLENLDSGWHSFKVIAVGNSCVERQSLKVNFVV